MAALPALARFLFLPALLIGGVIAMHAVTFSLGNDHDGHRSTTAVVQHHTAGGHSEPAGTPCDTDDCGQHHTGLHGCVFVMTAIAILAGLTLLYWVGIGRAGAFVSTKRHQCRRRERAPPWTVLSLHELSILRV